MFDVCCKSVRPSFDFSLPIDAHFTVSSNLDHFLENMTSFVRCAIALLLLEQLIMRLATSFPAPNEVLREDTEEKSLFVMKKTHFRHDWCKTRLLKQVVEAPGCRPLQVHNNYCLGQCNSMYIPLSGRNANSFESCAVCTPMLAYYKVVTLKCPRAVVKYKHQKIMYIKRCRCTAAKLTALDQP